ncbi:MAG: hypothetical protein KJ025_04935 [Burkholderiales bacterium]|nr:hypothetical protein [Burkholderiales bacterium]
MADAAPRPRQHAHADRGRPAAAMRRSARTGLGRALLAAALLCAPAASATAAELKAPRTAPTTTMEQEMEALRHELNALAAELQRIRGTVDAGERRALVRAQLARLREATASMRAMDARMHEALDRGQIASDPGAMARHRFLLDQVAATVTLTEAMLAEALPAEALPAQRPCR